MRISCFLNSMQRYIENKACQKAFTSVHFPFTNVHRTFILVEKIDMKKAVKQAQYVMLYDYVSSCCTTIGCHVVRS